MGRPPEEAQLEKLARAILGVGAEQAKAELASGEISDTPAGEAFAIVLAQGRVIDAARDYLQGKDDDEPLTRMADALAALDVASGGETETP